MSLFYENLVKKDTFGKLGVIVVKETSQLDILSKKAQHFKDNNIEILVVTSLIPNDFIYTNCNFLIYDILSKRNEFEIIWDFARDKKFTKVLFYDKFVAEILLLDKTYEEFVERLEELRNKKENFVVNFLSGAYLLIEFPYYRSYYAQFWDRRTGNIIYSCDIWNGGWSLATIKYFVDYNIKVFDKLTDELLWDYSIDLRGKNVYISMESSALGDTIAWMGQIEDFIEKHQCNLTLSTFHNHLFEENYPNINFVKPGGLVWGIFAQYRLGWFYKHDSTPDYSLHPRDFKTIPLHQTTSDILGLDFKQKRPRIKIPDLPPEIEGDYVVIGPHSTTQAKFWNNKNGWQELVDFFNKLGWKVVVISREGDGFMGNHFPVNVIDKSGDYPLENRVNDIRWSKMFIGLGSGLTWLAWATGVPLTIISGFSEPWTEPSDDNILRIHNSTVCNSCFNRYRLNAGDWNWCPDNKDTPDQFICTKSITAQDVISRISNYFKISNTIHKTDLLMIKSLLKISEIKKITFFTQNKEVKQFFSPDFELSNERGVCAVFTDKLPEIAYPLFGSLLKPGGVIVLYELTNYDYIEKIAHPKIIWKDPHTDTGFCIIYLR